MVNLPLQLSHDLERLGDDSRATLPGKPPENAAEIEELIAKAVHLYGRLKRRHDRWAQPVHRGAAPFDLQEAKLWQATFQEWADDARQIIRQAKSLDVQPLEQLEALRSMVDHCEYDGLDVEQLITNGASLNEGEGTPLPEISDELQRRLGRKAEG